MVPKPPNLAPIEASTGPQGRAGKIRGRRLGRFRARQSCETVTDPAGCLSAAVLKYIQYSRGSLPPAALQGIPQFHPIPRLRQVRFPCCRVYCETTGWPEVSQFYTGDSRDRQRREGTDVGAPYLPLPHTLIPLLLSPPHCRSLPPLCSATLNRLTLVGEFHFGWF